MIGPRWVDFVFALAFAIPLVSEDSRAQVEPATELSDMTDRAIRYLLSHGQADDGSFSAALGPGVTALVTAAIMRHGRGVDDPHVAKGLGYLERFIRADGGIYQENTLFRNYETCLSMICFQEANADGRFDTILRNAQEFIMEVQWDEGDGKTPDNFAYGGAGYGKHLRPDLSNTSFFIDALKSVKTDLNSDAIQHALQFISRCQNHDSENNTTPFSTKVGDGGFYYTPAAGGTSQAGVTVNGGLRSYGSMTYAGLKSMIYAGVGPDDPRVKAAVDWIRKHYTLKKNPGMANGNHGLYYYFHTFAKALDAIGEDTFIDSTGTKHDWRRELIDELKRRQQADGSWANQVDRWLEGDPNLVTGYALLALSYCREESH